MGIPRLLHISTIHDQHDSSESTAFSTQRIPAAIVTKRLLDEMKKVQN